MYLYNKNYFSKMYLFVKKFVVFCSNINGVLLYKIVLGFCVRNGEVKCSEGWEEIVVESFKDFILIFCIVLMENCWESDVKKSELNECDICIEC